MTKIRVYEAAKDLKINSKELVRLLEQLGIQVSSHMSTLEDSDLTKVRQRLEELRSPKEKTDEKKAAGNKSNDHAVKRTDASVKSNLVEKPKQQPQTNQGKKPDHSKPDKKGNQSQRFQKTQGGYRDRGKYPQKRHKRGGRPQVPTASAKKIDIPDEITVQDLAKKMGIAATEIIKKLMALGTMASMTQSIDAETAVIIAQELGVKVNVKSERELLELEDIVDTLSDLKKRPPVVTVMGHVDHGKTSLLDAIRKTKVTATEAGGITQHIGAYQVEVKGNKITFLDTPGHEAFTSMRARGAMATDIAILVVAADDGVMPQTVEAINHAKAAGVPIVVAINKIDRPDAQPDRVMQQLTEYGLVPEEWGGETICAPVSAMTGEGLDQLLEMIILVSEMEELKANPNRPAKGIVIEAEVDKGRGPVATILVQKGSIKIGDSMVAGSIYGKVRAMINYQGERIDVAGPSSPVEVLGLNDVPSAGDVFQVVEDDKTARSVAEHRHDKQREDELKKSTKVSLEDFFKEMEQKEIKELNVVIKADVQGSVEALRSSLERLSNAEVKVTTIHGGVGGITETDVMLAAASNALIIGFNVRPDNNARKAAEREQVEINTYRVIYEAIDEVRAALSGLLDPEIKEIFLGHAEVRAVFRVPRAGAVAGSYVTEGKMNNKAQVRVIRDGVVIHEGKITSLKRFKDDVKEVSQGYECGIGLENFNDIKEGDIIEAFAFQEIARAL